MKKDARFIRSCREISYFLQRRLTKTYIDRKARRKLLIKTVLTKVERSSHKNIERV